MTFLLSSLRKYSRAGLLLLSLLMFSFGAAVAQSVPGPAESILLPADGAPGDNFGVSVSLSGDRALIGANLDDDRGTDSGSAYLYEWNGEQWVRLGAKLLAPDGAAGAQFGNSVSLSGNRALIGAFGVAEFMGAAYVFEWTGESWVLEARMVAPDSAAGDLFGASVSLSGNRALIGAYDDDDNGSGSGSAYVYEWNGEQWLPLGEKIVPDDGVVSANFGYSVSLNGDRALVGAFRDDENGDASGSAYVYEWNGSQWTQLGNKLLASDGESGDLFGSSVSLGDNRALIGAKWDVEGGRSSGSAYAFEWNGEQWVQAGGKLLAPDAAPVDRFGQSVSLNGDRALVGAYQDDDNGDASGSAYVFEWDGEQWSPFGDKLLPSDGAAGDEFGVSVSLSEDRALIGANLKDDNGTDSGGAYVMGLSDPLVVTHVDDSGPGSLRDAILFANETSGLNTITFDIPTDGLHSIALDAPLPIIVDPVIIDGTTQLGASCGSAVHELSPMVEVNGFNLTGTAAGFEIGAGADGSTVRGLIIQDMPGDGILIAGSDNNVVECNRILENGLRNDAQRSGVRIAGGTANRVGGGNPGEGNQISGNDSGIWIGSGGDGNSAYGNYIGTDLTGLEAFGNQTTGVIIAGTSNNRIGGLNEGERNVISGNVGDGISIAFESATDNTVQGNYIGTNANGTDAVANGVGMTINNSSSNLVGDGNVISGNLDAGIRVFAGEGFQSTANRIENNYIGTNAAGTAAIPNRHGVHLSNRSNGNYIGGEDRGNLISGNSNTGVSIIGESELGSGDGAESNFVQGNLFGTTADGASDIDSVRQGWGIYIQGSHNEVGGGHAEAANLISGHLTGVEVQGSRASTNKILGNRIGTNAAGLAAIPNGRGVAINDANDTVIGEERVVDGELQGIGNIISGNINAGIEIVGGADGVIIQANLIGVDATGGVQLANGNGVNSTAVAGLRIGGQGEDAGNVISGNSEGGIVLGSGTRDVEILGNYIGTNQDSESVIGNGSHGIALTDVVDAQIGSAEFQNVVSGNEGSGIFVDGSSGVSIINNRIGTTVNGATPLGNLESGVSVQNASGVVIGGVFVGNVISANGTHGIELQASSDNAILGNLIGLNATGTESMGNDLDGIVLSDSPNNVVGGYFDSGSPVTEPGAGNVISGNDNAGVYIVGNASSGNTIIGNLVGTSADGIFRRSNDVGVHVDGAPDNVIGGVNDGEGNVISGNDEEGILVRGGGATGNLIRGNTIGLAQDGFTPLGNGSGIVVNREDEDALTYPSNNLIGGTESGAGNVIANNERTGVGIRGGTGNGIRSNSIYANGRLGIDLGHIEGGPEHVTPNDVGDADEGANNLLNFPVLNEPTFGNNTVIVSGNHDGPVGENFTIEFFANESCDPSGHGEGRTFLGSTSVTGGGETSFEVALATEGDVGSIITATATDATNNTSEFSKCPLPEVTAPYGYLAEVFADGFDQPQGLAVDNAGHLIVTATGSGEVFHQDGVGGWELLADGFSRPVDVAIQENTMYVTDLDYNGIFQIPLLQDGIFTVDPGNAWVSGLNGPSHLEFGPDGDLFVSVVRGADDQVMRVDVETATAMPVITFAEDSNPQGLTFGNDKLYVAYQFTGEVRSTRPTGVVDGGSLPVTMSELDSPGGIAYGLGDRLYVATPSEVVLGLPGVTAPTPFASGLSGDDFNNLMVADNGTIYVADRAGGRILRFAVPRDQVLASGNTTYVISEGGNPTISDGSDFTAIHNAFGHWESIETATIDFEYGGTDTSTVANGTDEKNLVTFRDHSFLFPPNGVLAVASKMLVFSEADDMTGEVVDWDIVFNPTFVHTTSNNRLSTDGSPTKFDIESIATHEVGHVLGLFHSGLYYASMWFETSKGTGKRTLEADDVAWASYKYPTADFEANSGAIEGTITDGETGEPIGGALVIADFADQAGLAVHAYTDENGFYHIPGLQSGDYKVLVRALDGDVWGSNFQPRNVSEYIRLIATNTRFPGEWWNLAESGDPTTDDPDEFSLVPVNSITDGKNITTNRDITPPTVTAFSPLHGASDVSSLAEVIITFSEPVTESSVEAAFSLIDSLTTDPVEGDFTFLDNDRTVVYTPETRLGLGRKYTFTLAAGVTDKSTAANALVSGVTSTFRVDDSMPSVTLVTPQDDSSDVFLTSDVVIVFSEPINPLTLKASTVTSPSESFALLDDSSTPVAGDLSFSVGNTVATFTPRDPLSEAETYTVSLNDASTPNKVTDVSGNELSTHSSDFATAVDADPFVDHIGPSPEDVTGVSVASPVLVDFSEPMDVSTINSSSFKVETLGDSPAVVGTFQFLNGDTRAVFQPATPLMFDTTYVVTLTTAITDKSDTPLVEDTTRTFTAASAPVEPAISAVSPPAGLVGTTVTISGTGFAPIETDNTVFFGSTEAEVTSSSLSSILTAVPDGETTGNVDLFVEVDGLQTNRFQFGVVDSVDASDGAIARVSSESARDADLGPDGTIAYLTNPSSNTVTPIEIATASVHPPGPIGVGQRPLHIAVTPDGSRAYVTNFDSHTVTAIDLSTFATTTIPVGIHPMGVAVAPDGSKVYVAEYSSRGITVIDADTSSGAFDSAIARVSSESANSDIELGPDGTLAFVTGNMGLSIFNLEDGAVARVSSETETRDVAISPDGAFAAVSTLEGELLIISVDPFNPISSSVVARVSSESDASSVEFGPDGTLFVTNFSDGTLTHYEISETEQPDAIGAKRGAEADMETGPALTLEVRDTRRIVPCAEGGALDPRTNNMIFTSTCVDSLAVVRFSLSPSEQIDALLDYLNDLVKQGKIKKAHSNALFASVRNAERHLFWGRERAAVNNLEAFIKKVQAFEAEGELEPAVADELERRAHRVISTIQGSSKGGSEEAVDEEPAELPAEFALRQNYPNPFNPTTTIEYDIPGGLDGPVRVRLEVYDILGRRVAILVDEEVSAGRYNAVWDGRTSFGAEAASGVYLFRIDAGEFRNVKKMTLVR